MLFVVILVLMIVFIIIFRPKPYQSNNQQEIKRIRNHSDGSWREDNYDGTFKIHDKKGAITVTRTYEGERYVDGRRVNNSDDMARWSVLKSLADGYWSRLLEIERLLEKNNTDDGDDLLKEWNQRYQKLRQLCIDNKLWNGLIGDRSPFIPTTSQLAKEAEIKEHIIKLHENWKSRMIENRIVLDYLEKCPRKHALKSVMLSDLSGKDPENKKKIQAIYRRLKSSGIIGEKENKEGKIEARIIVRRSKNDQHAKSLPASTYHSSIYENVRRYDIYKVDYTVGAPERLDRSMNTCQFTSKTSGENYLTSLEQCTCPAYIKGRACKHMLALAIQLGYYKRSDAQP